MPVAKAKKKVQRRSEIGELISPQAQKAAERRVRNYLMLLDEKSELREAYTQIILDANPPSVEATVDFIADQLRKMQPQADKEVIPFEGANHRLVGGEIEMVRKIEDRNYRYIAIRILVACAEWNIRVGDFTLPSRNCARCGKKVR